MRIHALCAATLAACASLAFGVPRETVSFVNQLSTPAPCDTGGAPTALAALTGGYAPKFIILSGQLQRLISGTMPLEAQIQIFTPTNQSFTVQPFITNPSFGSDGTILLADFVVKVPVDVADAAGQWAFRFSDSYNDGGTADDARWNTITFTFDDGPPASKYLGVPQALPLRQLAVPLGAGQVLWYRIDLPRDVRPSLGTFVDIDTAQGAYFDTMIGLYNAQGQLMAYDDDDAGSGASALTFGVGGRPGIIAGYPFDGRDGSLTAGTYYLALCGYTSGAFAATGWRVTSASTLTGSVYVRVNANMTPGGPHLGTLTQAGAVVRDADILPGQVLWFRFELAQEAIASSGGYLDVHTLGSYLPGSFSDKDTQVALYDVAGNLIAYDDDGAGIENLSLLSFGVGGRGPIAPGGFTRNGQDGTLPAGTYYLAASAYATGFGATDWSVATTHVRTGKLRINFLTNTGAAATCPADLDNGSGSGVPDGGVTIDDLLYFLLRYEGGC